MQPGTRVGELKVWNVINPPNEPTLAPVASPEIAKEVIDRMAKAQLNSPWIEANAFGLIVWDGTEWVEWESEDGYDIDEWEAK
jgi:hypothetical protein